MVECNAKSKADDQQIPNKTEPREMQNHHTELKLFFNHFFPTTLGFGGELMLVSLIGSLSGLSTQLFMTLEE